MVTTLGRELRHIRLEKNMLLKDMANKMNVKASYISSIENGKREPNDKFIKNVIESLKLNAEEIEIVEEAYYKTIEEIKIDLKSKQPFQVELGLVLARSIDNITEEKTNLIKEILKSNEE